jgi:hypothetical protein
MADKASLKKQYKPLVPKWSSDEEDTVVKPPKIRSVTIKPPLVADTGSSPHLQASVSPKSTSKDSTHEEPLSFSLSAPPATSKVLSLAERTKLLYTAKSDSTKIFKPCKVMEDALADDIESHRVMYQYMFVENKRKKQELVDKMLAHEEGEVSSGVRYLSVLNARRNPDLIVSGGRFLKGNQYFRGEQAVAPSGEESDPELDEEEEFNKMMQS